VLLLPAERHGQQRSTKHLRLTLQVLDERLVERRRERIDPLGAVAFVVSLVLNGFFFATLLDVVNVLRLARHCFVWHFCSSIMVWQRTRRGSQPEPAGPKLMFAGGRQAGPHEVSRERPLPRPARRGKMVIDEPQNPTR